MSAPVLEVWGDPIAHSLSPSVHTAAYAHLGWDWTYGRRRVSEDGFAAELAGLDERYRGLSCTMPLKSVAFAAAESRDDRSELTGAVNTLLLTEGRRRGYNTDVGGIVRALSEHGITLVERARILGAGATATSALVALAEMGAREVEIRARRPEAAGSLVERGERLGVVVRARALEESAPDTRELTISTVPADAAIPAATAVALADAGGALFDVGYGHGATALRTAWHETGALALPGEALLLHQALLQIRIFATADVSEPLPDEASVLAVMRRALVGG